jgi:hypothetical protein
MSGERSSTTRMWLNRKNLLLLRRYLGATLLQPPGERACGLCATQRVPAPKLRHIHMSFILRERWYCTFMEEDLRTQAAPLAYLLKSRQDGRDDSPRQRIPRPRF